MGYFLKEKIDESIKEIKNFCPHYSHKDFYHTYKVNTPIVEAKENIDFFFSYNDRILNVPNKEENCYARLYTFEDDLVIAIDEPKDDKLIVFFLPKKVLNDENIIKEIKETLSTFNNESENNFKQLINTLENCDIEYKDLGVQIYSRKFYSSLTFRDPESGKYECELPAYDIQECLIKKAGSTTSTVLIQNEEIIRDDFVNSSKTNFSYYEFEETTFDFLKRIDNHQDVKDIPTIMCYSSELPDDFTITSKTKVMTEKDMEESQEDFIEDSLPDINDYFRDINDCFPDIDDYFYL